MGGGWESYGQSHFDIIYQLKLLIVILMVKSIERNKCSDNLYLWQYIMYNYCN